MYRESGDMSGSMAVLFLRWRRKRAPPTIKATSARRASVKPIAIGTGLVLVDDGVTAEVGTIAFELDVSAYEGSMLYDQRKGMKEGES